MQKDRSFPIICSVVIALHGSLLLFLAFSNVFSMKLANKPPQRLVVQTVALTESPKSKPIELTTNSVLKKEIPLGTEAPKKEISKPDIKKVPPRIVQKENKKIKVETKKSEIKSPQKKQNELFDKAKESMAKIAQQASKAFPKKQATEAIGSLKIDAQTDLNVPFSEQESIYRQELASRLKLLLQLPEHGEVKLKLTLERIGKVAKLVIVSAESLSNRNYVEQTLPSLKFPAFGNNFTTESDYTFSITLRNE